jgi:thioesterase domain-containing protein
VLGVPRVGIFDNFFAHGGHSLLAVRLASEIGKDFGREIPIASLFEAPDIARQALLLDAEAATWSPLVGLAAGEAVSPIGTGAPCFFVHAVSGTVFAYGELAQYLGPGRPVYALEAPEASRHPETIEDLAALYVDAIRTVRADGPYHLGGWSLGGVIAFEMARQLTELGATVASLSLIDSYTPDAARRVAGALDDEAALRAAFAGELAAAGGDGMDGDTWDALFARFKANVRAMNSYQPKPFKGNATLFAAQADVACRGDWGALIEGYFTTMPVPGDHNTLLQRPHVEVLADALQQLMKDAVTA